MIRVKDVVKGFDGAFSLDDRLLEDYIARGWVRPMRDEEDYAFDDADIARVHLVCELHINMEFEPDAVDLILSLMDQLYESRSRLDSLVRAVESQPANICEAVIKSLKEEVS